MPKIKDIIWKVKKLNDFVKMVFIFLTIGYLIDKINFIKESKLHNFIAIFKFNFKFNYNFGDIL